MKIGIVGYGRMGRMVESVALAKGHQIVWRIDPHESAADSQNITVENCKDADLCIEFSLPTVASDNFKKLIPLNIPIVTGTTGWYEEREAIELSVRNSNGSFLYAANFSVGMNLFYRVVEASAHIFNSFSNYDPYVFEQHHHGKVDSPSGTALELSEILISNLEHKNHVSLERLQSKIDPNALSVSAIRAGGAPGSHTVGFDGEFDSITLNHTNRSRESLAQGAILAAEWLMGKTGFFEFSEVIDDKIQSMKNGERK